MKLLTVQDKKILFWLSALHLFWFVLMLFLNSNAFTADSYSYLNEAKNIWRASNTYCVKLPATTVFPEYFSFRTPGYPIFLLLISLGSFNLEIVFFVQLLLSVFTYFYLYKFIEQELILNNKGVKIFFVLCLFLFPFQYWYCRLLLTEIVFQSALFFSMVYAYKWNKNRTNSGVLFSAILFSIAFLIKPVLLYFVPIFIFYFVFKAKFKFASYLMFLFLPVLTWYGNSKLNEYQTGYFHYTSIPPIYTVNYQVKYALSAEYGKVYACAAVSQIYFLAEQKIDLQAKLMFLKDTSVVILAQYPYNAFKYNLKGMIGFWIDPGRFDVFQILNIPQDSKLSFGDFSKFNSLASIYKAFCKFPLLVILFLCINFISALFLLISFLYVLSKKQLRKKYVFFFILIIYVWLISAGLGALRFKLALLPLLIFFSAIAFNDFYNWIQIRKAKANF